MKTIEKIKKGHECCASYYRCRECPYSGERCAITLSSDTLGYIQQLERERDAAIEDIKKAALFLCQTCKKYHPAIVDGSKHYCDRIPADHFDDGAIACGMYEWRGVQEDNDEDA